MNSNFQLPGFMGNRFHVIILVFIVSSFGIQNSYGQFSQNQLKKFVAYEDTLNHFADSLVTSDFVESRIRGAYMMIPTLVSALKMENSFYYPFDSVKAISIVYPEDRKFRIFTWSLELESGAFRHFGAIQMKSKKELKLFPLIDASNYITHPADTVLNKDCWFGAMYYNMITRKFKGRKYYYLFGYDSNDKFSTIKLVDVLYFEDDQPLFGAPVFSKKVIENGIEYETIYHRLLLEYTKSAGVSLNFYNEFGKIIYDHCVPKNPISVGVYSTYIPDGTYEGYSYKKGMWHYIDKVFDFSIDHPDNPPVPKPVDFRKEKQNGNKH